MDNPPKKVYDQRRGRREEAEGEEAEGEEAEGRRLFHAGSAQGDLTACASCALASGVTTASEVCGACASVTCGASIGVVKAAGDAASTALVGVAIAIIDPCSTALIAGSASFALVDQRCAANVSDISAASIREGVSRIAKSGGLGFTRIEADAWSANIAFGAIGVGLAVFGAHTFADGAAALRTVFVATVVGSASVVGSARLALRR